MQINVSANNMHKIIFVLPLLLLLTSCKDKTCTKELKLERGKISIPCEWTHKKKSPMDDFIIYSFADSSNVEVLFLYIGNHPSPSVPDGPLIKSIETKHSDYNLKEVVWAPSENHFSGGIDIEFNSHGWPEAFQFSYSNLGLTSKETVDTVINSFTP